MDGRIFVLEPFVIWAAGSINPSNHEKQKSIRLHHTKSTALTTPNNLARGELSALNRIYEFRKKPCSRQIQWTSLKIVFFKRGSSNWIIGRFGTLKSKPGCKRLICAAPLKTNRNFFGENFIHRPVTNFFELTLAKFWKKYFSFLLFFMMICKFQPYD